MAKTNPSYLVDTTFSTKDIHDAASVYAWTVAANCKVQIIVAMTIAGTGDYIAYLTHRWLGAGNVYVLLPKTTGTSAAGETIIEFATIPMHFKATDVVNVMVDGLAADTSISGVIRIVAEDPSVFEATDTVTLVTTTTNLTNASTLADAVDAIWNELVADHLTANTTGAYLNILTGITSLAKWLRGLFRKDAMDVTAKAEVNTGGGTFSETTDSLEANRDNIGTTGAALTTLGDTHIANLDATVSSRSTFAGGAVASVTNPVVASSVTGNVAGSVGSVTNPVTVGANNDKSGYALSVTPPTVDQINTKLSTVHGVGLWTSGTSGAINFRYTVTDSVTGTPIDGVSVIVTDDIAGTNMVDEGITNEWGTILFYLDVGTYYFWSIKSGVTFTNPDTETVSP